MLDKGILFSEMWLSFRKSWLKAQFHIFRAYEVIFHRNDSLGSVGSFVIFSSKTMDSVKQKSMILLYFLIPC